MNRRWLTDPFHFIAGAPSLIVGVITLALAAIFAGWGGVQFDGVIDAHYGARVTMSRTLGEAFAQGGFNALVMATVLLPFALVIARPGMRLIDLFGTQALARTPFVFVALLMAVFPLVVDLPDMAALLEQAQAGVALTPAQTLPLLALSVLTLPLVLWSVYLMYRSFATCTGASGPKAIACFAVALIVAEVLSKIAYGFWFGMSPLSP